MRPIDGDKLLEEIQDLIDSGMDCNAAFEAVRYAPTITPSVEWIDVKNEKPPAVECLCLVNLERNFGYEAVVGIPYKDLEGVCRAITRPYPEERYLKAWFRIPELKKSK